MEAAVDGGKADAVSAARAMIADPYLYRNVLDEAADRPVCGYCNGCIARFGGLPVDCCSDEIRHDRDAMIARHRARTAD
ncbi:hypothetical protein [Streptomyces fulvoviolaceus]|uniref:hypothetical protein n=1 Tax=Streptomyces fulvoviolaceus TaxID=285535 RepID=UPI000693F59C|nr:hypothetical protein [Streptomyces fulvoviolaceus]